jgi:hypothetical protein
MNEENSSDLFFIKKSKLHGNGLFAKKFIKKDTYLLDLKFTVLPKDCAVKYIENNSLYSEIEKQFIKYYNVLTFDNYLNKIHFICADGYSHYIYMMLLGDASFINNSFSDDNQNVKITYHPKEEKMYMSSVKDIQVGEEIITNYGDFNKINN